MTEPTPASPESPRHKRDTIPEPEIMPRWVPVLIGLVLVSLAALAVITGWRFEDNRFTRSSKPRVTTTERRVLAPSGEPVAGGSLVLSDDAVPAGKAPVTGSARAVVTGGPGGTEATVRIWARRGMIVTGAPPDAIVYVNETLVGPARQLDTQDEIYDFPEPGSYTVRVTAPGHRDRQYIVTAAEDAKDDVAVIEGKLTRD